VSGCVQAGADPANKFREVISVIFGSQVSLRVHYYKRDEVNTAVTKQWTPKWPYIANVVFQIFKIIVKKDTFVGFTVGDRPPP